MTQETLDHVLAIRDRLRLARVQVMAADGAVRDAVRSARHEGLSWEAIGRVLGVTGEAVRKRYGTHG